MPWRFFWLLGLGGLAGCAGCAALVLSTATWAEARALDAIFPKVNWHIRSFTATDFQAVRLALTGAALALAAAGVGVGVGTRAGRRQVAATARELAATGPRLRQRWRALRPAQRRLAAGGLLGLTLLRLALSTSEMPWGDDVLSYEFFVRQRLLAVSAYYPLPNNHVLANTIGWLCYQVHPSFWGAVRLPVLLASTLGSGVLFAGLWRRAGFGVALLAAGAFSGLQLSLYYAWVGRGYWLVSLLAGVVFGCLLELLDVAGGDEAPPRRPRVAWLGLFGAGVLGCYTVPTFAYVLASAFTWLGWQAGRRWAWGLLGRALAVGGLIGAATALLYAPLLLVSGRAALADNAYTQPWPPLLFWRALPAYVWQIEGALAGQRSLGPVLWVGGLGLFGRLWYRAATGQLPPAQARRVTQVGLPALWFGLFPYLVLSVQRLHPPERTLLYKAWFFFVLLALVAENYTGQWARRRWLAGAAGGLFLLYQVGAAGRLNYLGRVQSASRQAVYTWLVQHPTPYPVLVPDYSLWLGLRLNAHIQAPTQPWRAEYVGQPGGRYAYCVTRPGDAPPPGAGPVVYATAELLVRAYRAGPRAQPGRPGRAAPTAP